MDNPTIIQYITIFGGGAILLSVINRIFTIADRRQTRSDTRVNESATVIVRQIDDDAKFRDQLMHEVNTLRVDLKQLQSDLLTYAKANAKLEADNEYLKREDIRKESQILQLTTEVERLRNLVNGRTTTTTTTSAANGES